MGFRRARHNSIVRRNPVILSTTQKEPASLYVPKSVIQTILAVILIAGLGYLCFFSHCFDVKDIVISGEISDNGRSVIEKYKGKNIFFVDNFKLASDLREVYPEAFRVNVYKGIPSTLKVVTAKRTVVMLWQSDGKNYMVDDMGIVFGEAKDPNDPKLKGLPLVVDIRNFKVSLGTRLISSRFISFAKYINDNFTQKEGIKLVRIEIDETSFSPILVTEFNWKVLMDSNRSPENQLDDLALILEKHKGDIHEYVDLRIPGYGYYK